MRDAEAMGIGRYRNRSQHESRGRPHVNCRHGKRRRPFLFWATALSQVTHGEEFDDRSTSTTSIYTRQATTLEFGEPTLRIPFGEPKQRHEVLGYCRRIAHPAARVQGRP